MPPKKAIQQPQQRATEQSVVEPVNLDQFLRVVNLDMALYSKRLATFQGVWRYGGERGQEGGGAICTPERMARAGFYSTEETPNSDAARCYVCQHELLWDAEDDPWEEHKKHRPDCELVKVGKQDEDEFTLNEQLRIMAYIYSTRMYEQVNESIADLKQIMEKLLADAEKLRV